MKEQVYNRVTSSDKKKYVYPSAGLVVVQVHELPALWALLSPALPLPNVNEVLGKPKQENFDEIIAAPEVIKSTVESGNLFKATRTRTYGQSNLK